MRSIRFVKVTKIKPMYETEDCSQRDPSNLRAERSAGGAPKPLALRELTGISEASDECVSPTISGPQQVPGKIYIT